jgi:hypothetical protein
LEDAFGVKGKAAIEKLEQALAISDPDKRMKAIEIAAGELEFGFTDLADDTEALRQKLL